MRALWKFILVVAFLLPEPECASLLSSMPPMKAISPREQGLGAFYQGARRSRALSRSRKIAFRRKTLSRSRAPHRARPSDRAFVSPSDERVITPARAEQASGRASALSVQKWGMQKFLPSCARRVCAELFVCSRYVRARLGKISWWAGIEPGGRGQAAVPYVRWIF